MAGFSHATVKAVRQTIRRRRRHAGSKDSAMPAVERLAPLGPLQPARAGDAGHRIATGTTTLEQQRGEPMAGTVETQESQQGKGEQAQDKAQEVAGQAREKAQEAAGEARSRLSEQVDQRTTQAGERISATGSDLRSVGQELRNQGKDTPARLADQAAERVERVGSYLGQSDADRILRDVEDFGRRQPLAVLAGGMVLGVAAARFLKASSSRRYGSRTAWSNGANHPDHAQRTVSAWEAGTTPPVATPDVRRATPDLGEHHQRFEGHN